MAARKKAEDYFRRPRRIGAPVEKAVHRRATFLRLLTYFHAERMRLLLLTFVVTAGVIAGVAAPIFQSQAIDAIAEAAYASLPRILLSMLAACALYAVMVFFQGRLSARLSQSIIRRLRRDLFDKINTLPLSYIDRHSHGDLMSRMTNDADNIASVISTSLGALFAGVLTLVGTAIVMLSFSVPLTLLTCLTVVATVLTTKLIAKKMGKYFLNRQELLGSLNGMVEEKVTAVRTVKAYSREERIIKEFEQTADALTKTGIRAESIGNSMGPLMNMISNCSFVIVSVFGAYFALKGWITVGVISAFIIYSKQFTRPINEIAQLYGQIETALAGAERIFAVLDEKSEPEGGAEVPVRTRDVIEFRHVNFSYVPEKRVIDDFNLKIEAGKKIALVGATGSGKTTIVNLLMRFYEIDSGEILLDGRDIREYSLSSLRGLVGIVLQDTVLFSDTVHYNLAYAKQNASTEEIERAAKLANADEFIRHLPKGYETVLTGAGSSLSEGQRQLLAIGRACLANPRILILDEATSNVDTRTEAKIQDAMTRLMHDRTCLIIAHRISTIRDADTIIVMEQGHIAQQGSHAELIKKEGPYRDLYLTQFAGQAS
ncbi:MAG: ABC transporter ATP-binding protein [Mitsuokella sp.]|uniref:ABC transporter ATP-binding protein n=1 Tax=Mitsuokella sp. TaxID=2049034 RepID=UPI003EFBC582